MGGNHSVSERVFNIEQKLNREERRQMGEQKRRFEDQVHREQKLNKEQKENNEITLSRNTRLVSGRTLCIKCGTFFVENTTENEMLAHIDCCQTNHHMKQLLIQAIDIRRMNELPTMKDTVDMEELGERLQSIYNEERRLQALNAPQGFQVHRPDILIRREIVYVQQAPPEQAPPEQAPPEQAPPEQAPPEQAPPEQAPPPYQDN